MKEGIHPVYEVTKIKCACGNVIETRSTVKDINVEICSACHPFFTGKQKLLDTEGRVDKFNKRFAATAGKTVVRKPKTEVKAKAKLVKKVVKKAAAPKKAAAKKAETAEAK